LPPVWESALSFIWKNAKNYVFHVRPPFGKNSKFHLLCWLNECRGAVFVIILWMWTSRQSRLTINVFAPSVGQCFKFHLKKCQKLRFSQKNFTWEKQLIWLVGLAKWVSGRCFRDYIMNVDFKAIKIDYKFYCPQSGKAV